jgi:DNA polymerase-1
MTKYEFCEDCPLIDQPMVPGAGTKGGLAIVGEAPGQQEVNRGEPFIGMSGILLKKMLNEVGIEEYWITNSCLCRPPKNATPPNSAIDACNDRLMEELQGCKKVLTLGATALTAVYGPTSIMSVRGARLWISQLNAYCVPTYHPAAVLRAPDYFPDLMSDLQLLKDVPTEYQEPDPPPVYTIVQTLEDVGGMCHRIALHDPTHLALDLETTGLDECEDKILVMGINDGCEIFVITSDVLYNDPPALKELKGLLESSYVWVAQNGPQFDRKFIKAQLGINWNVNFDCMLAHYCLDERQGSHSLKTLARKYFQAPEYDAALKSSKGKLSEVPVNQLYQYLAYDVYYTHKLAWVLADELNEQGLRHIHDDILLPASHALGEIEHHGIMIDKYHLKTLGTKLEKEIAATTIELQLETKNPKFNPNSPKQVADYLYGTLKLRPEGSAKTSKEELKDLNHPLATKILELRQKQKLLSTYVRGLLERVSEDGRIRASFLLHGTVTGRLSSRDPNLQNIPARAGVIIRDAFIAPPGWTLLEADYNQLELRIAAYYSQDPNMCKTFAEEEDIHARVARTIFGLRPEDPVTRDQRYAAKFVDFGIVYGRGAKSLAEGELNCSVRKAQQFLNNFLGGFPVLHKWMISSQKSAVREGFIESAFGRKRRFALVTERNKHEIERQAVNAPIQSAASDLNLLALTRLHARLDPKVAHILVTVHDSLLLEVKKGHEEKVLDIIYEEMVDNAPLDAPFNFSIDCKGGARWGSLNKIPRG